MCHVKNSNFDYNTWSSDQKHLVDSNPGFGFIETSQSIATEKAYSLNESSSTKCREKYHRWKNFPDYQKKNAQRVNNCALIANSNSLKYQENLGILEKWGVKFITLS